MVAVAKDGRTAETWQQLLEDEDIPTEIRLGDPAIAGEPSRAAQWGRSFSPIPSLVSYPLYVRRRDRRAARSILGEHADLGGLPVDRGVVAGALAVVGLTLLGVFLMFLWTLRG
jgi:hypothetical protein